jgi:tRNA pseudouridine55 synthase
VIDRVTALADPQAASNVITSEAGALILVDKPYGETSFFVVNQIRKAISRQIGCRIKCGHAGTLDPLATGLLIIATRRQTKSLQSLIGLDKTYRLRLRFGITSPSFDLERPIEIIGGEAQITEEAVRQAIESLVGEHAQIPPAFSAIKQQGKSVYLKARAGIEVTLESRPIVVHEVEVLEIALPFVSFRVRCSKGTYIRSIVRDLGVSLGTGAILTDLSRETIGPYKLEDALTLTEILNVIATVSTFSTSAL